MTDNVAKRIDEIYRNDARKIFATLLRLLHRFDLAEEALHDAFVAAAQQWPKEGVPQIPFAWLISAGRFKAVDGIRRGKRLVPLDDVAEFVESLTDETTDDLDDATIEDDQLRLIFTCCHPSLSEEARIALTLREVCGLSTENVAHAFLVSPATLAQRIVRAKAKIHTARIPYEVPPVDHLPERLPSVLRVIYLVFNEGYSASAGDHTVRHDFVNEAIRLGRLLLSLLPEPEVRGLLALMLLQHARSKARVNAEGDLVPLEEQDRSRWDRNLIAEGDQLVLQALQSRRFGSYTLQAAIAAVHDTSATAQETDWPQIVGLYDALLRVEPSPVIELNRAVAVAMRDGPEAGLELIEPMLQHEHMRKYHLTYAAKAELCRRLDRIDAAHEAFQTALALTVQEPERRLLQKRLNALDL